jgi:hypothetical protein
MDQKPTAISRCGVRPQNVTDATLENVSDATLAAEETVVVVGRAGWQNAAC